METRLQPELPPLAGNKMNLFALTSAPASFPRDELLKRTTSCDNVNDGIRRTA